MTARSGVADLRQYTLVPGQRDTLIDLFDRYFVDGQEAVGIHVIGQFRDLDDQDRFVWLRGFDSMPDRAAALQCFYNGPVWRAHRDRANAMMIGSDDALLLAPLEHGAPGPACDVDRVDAPTASVAAITVAHLAGPVADADGDLARSACHRLAAAGAEVVAAYTTHLAENNSSVLPLRDEHVLVWITRFADDAEYAEHRNMLADSAAWRDTLRRLAVRSDRLPMQQLRLRPTVRACAENAKHGLRRRGHSSWPVQPARAMLPESRAAATRGGSLTGRQTWSTSNRAARSPDRMAPSM